MAGSQGGFQQPPGCSARQRRGALALHMEPAPWSRCAGSSSAHPGIFLPLRISSSEGNWVDAAARSGQSWSVACRCRCQSPEDPREPPGAEGAAWPLFPFCLPRRRTSSRKSGTRLLYPQQQANCWALARATGTECHRSWGLQRDRASRDFGRHSCPSRLRAGRMTSQLSPNRAAVSVCLTRRRVTTKRRQSQGSLHVADAWGTRNLQGLGKC